MKEYDIATEIPKKIREESLPEWLEKLYRAAFLSQLPLAVEWEKAQAMCDMRFTNQDLILSKSSLKNAFRGEKADDDDFESLMYDPMSSRMVDTLSAHLRRVGIPVNRDIFNINYDYHGVLSDRFPFLVHLMEEAYQDFGKRAFQRAKIISKLVKGQRQAVIKGNTVLNLDYDKTMGLVDAKVLKIENFALYPPKDESDKCYKVVRSDIPESDLKIRFDIPSDALEELIPAKDITLQGLDVGNTQYYPSDTTLPFGRVRVWVFFLPYYRDYVEEQNTGKMQKFELTNALVLLGVNELGGPKGESGAKARKVLLKVIELDNADQCPILFSTLTPPEVGSPWGKTVLLKYRGHQTTLNQLDFAANKAVPMYIDPVKKVVSDGTQTSEDYEIGPGSVLFCKNKDDITFENVQANLQHYILFKDHIERDFGKGFGVTELMEGAQRTKGGDKTATEASEERKSGEVKIDYISEWQNDNYFAEFNYKYLLLTQLYIEQEVESAKVIWAEAVGSSSPEEQNGTFWQWAKGETSITIGTKEYKNPCPLYKNFLVFSKLEQKLQDKFAEMLQPNPITGESMPVTASIASKIFSDPNGDELLYQAIIYPIHNTDISTEASTGEVSKAAQRQNFQAAMQVYNGLDTPNEMGVSRLGQEGLKLNPKEIIRLTDKFYSLPSNKLIVPNPQAIPQAPMAQQGNMPGQPAVSQSVTGEARNQASEQVAIENPQTEQGV